MSQSLKDTKSLNVTVIKADGHTRTIPGSFSISSNVIGTLPANHLIQVGDRVSFSVTTSATLTESGLIGVMDISGLEAGTGGLRIDKAESLFGTLGAIQAAFTAGTTISFQSGILSGASVNVMTSPILGNVTVQDGSALGDPGYWIMAIDLTTASGFPAITSYPTWTTISPSISIYVGIGGTTNYNNLPVSVSGGTTITVEGVIPNNSFTDLSVTKHSRIESELIAQGIQASSLQIQGSEVTSQIPSIPFSGIINELKLLWKGYNNVGDVISSDKPNLAEITPTDSFNVGVDINLLELLSHPINKDIGIMLYQDIASSNIYLKCFKYTYEAGFVNTYTPYLISGADSTDIRIQFSTFVSAGTGDISDPLLFIVGGKATPGTAIYAGVVSINTTTLAISDTGLFAWGDTTITTTTNSFITITKFVDLQPIYDPPMRRMAVVYNGTNVLQLTFDTSSQTFGVSGDYDNGDYANGPRYDYFAVGSNDVVVVTETSIGLLGGTLSSISSSHFSRLRKVYTGANHSSVTLYRISSYEGAGGETFKFDSTIDPSTSIRSNVNFDIIPLQNDVSNRGNNRVFEIGGDKLIFYQSFGYYFIVDKHTGKLIHFGRVGSGTIYRFDPHVVCLNDSTILRYASSTWKATKFLTDGPYVAYKKVGNNAFIANDKTKVSTDFSLVKGATYYASYTSLITGATRIISAIPNFAAKKIGVAVDTNILYVDTDFSASSSMMKNPPASLEMAQTPIVGGAGDGHILLQQTGKVAQSGNLMFDVAGSKLGVGVGITPEFSLQTYGGVASGLPASFTPSGTMHDVSSGSTNILVSQGTAESFITGFTTGFTSTSGSRYLFLQNSSIYPLTLKHQNAGSTASNRITTPTGQDYIVMPGKTCLLICSTTSSWSVVDTVKTTDQIVYAPGITYSFENICKTWDEVCRLIDYNTYTLSRYTEVLILGGGGSVSNTYSGTSDLRNCKLRGIGYGVQLSFANGNTIFTPLEIENLTIVNNTTGGHFAFCINRQLTLRNSVLIHSSACTTYGLLVGSLGLPGYILQIFDYGNRDSDYSIIRQPGAAIPITDTPGNLIQVDYNCFSGANLADDVLDVALANVYYQEPPSLRVYKTSQPSVTTINHYRKNLATAPISITGTSNVNLSFGESYNVDPTANTVITISDFVSGNRYTFRVKQGATPYTVGFSSTPSIKWVGGTGYTATNSANAIDIVTLYYDGTDLLGSFESAYA